MKVRCFVSTCSYNKNDETFEELTLKSYKLIVHHTYINRKHRNFKLVKNTPMYEYGYFCIKNVVVQSGICTVSIYVLRNFCVWKGLLFSTAFTGAKSRVENDSIPIVYTRNYPSGTIDTKFCKLAYSKAYLKKLITS